MVAPESNDARPPHPWFLLGNFWHEDNQTLRVMPLLLVRNGSDVTLVMSRVAQPLSRTVGVATSTQSAAESEGKGSRNEEVAATHPRRNRDRSDLGNHVVQRGHGLALRSWVPPRRRSVPPHLRGPWVSCRRHVLR